jgi:PHD/YefM family antitoxin component YafN of YafNO toxin-antitoxin module
MTATQPMTDTIASDDALEHWETLLDRVSRREARFIVEREGKPVAALISAHDLEVLEAYQRRREKDFEILDIIQERFKDVPTEELQREIDNAIANVRAARRQSVDTNSADVA